MTPQQTAAAVEEAHAAWKSWRKAPFSERARPMKKAAAILRERKEEFAKLMALEMGKPLQAGRRGSREVRARLRLLRRPRRGASRARDGQDRGVEVLRRVRAARRRARRDAVELSVLAGVPVCRAGADGRQRRRAEARVERARAARSRSKKCSCRRDSRKACFARSSSAASR